MNQNIMAIHVIGGDSYYVGFDKRGLEVTSIVNHSQEFSDHTEHFYQVNANGQVITQIINCPVVVDYECK